MRTNIVLAGIAVAMVATAQAQSPAAALRPNVISCKPIRTAAQLQAMKNDLGASYCLEADIDLAPIKDFTPIGDEDAPFAGNFFGNNHTIRNLKIKSSTASDVGLFGLFVGGAVRDLKLAEVDIHGPGDSFVGGLIGRTGPSSTPSTISNVSVSGTIQCPAVCGGIVGQLVNSTLARSSSSATMTGGTQVGGLVGINQSTIADSFATGDVTCLSNFCVMGGLAGETVLSSARVDRSFATGAVTGGPSTAAGGLLGVTQGQVNQSFATGPVIVGSGGVAGGLIGECFGSSGVTNQSYSIGAVLGAGTNMIIGGLVGGVFDGSFATNSYWDTDTSRQAASIVGTGLTTTQLRAALPAGFDPSYWIINPGRSYPVPNNADLAFNSALATALDRGFSVNVLVPIGQRDRSQYTHEPRHAAHASLATVNTMIARAVGLARGDESFRNVKIDHFWHDATQRTTFAGRITEFVKLGDFKPVAPAADLTPVVNILDGKRLVILRGTYVTASGAKAKHWMLATLSTKEGNRVGVIAANDPWTGTQVAVDLHTKTVVSPDFPLAHFKVDGFQPVTFIFVL